MAEGDPQTPDMTATTQSAEEAAQALESLQDAATNAKNSMSGLNSVTNSANEIFNSFNTVLNGYGMSLKTVGSLTEQQTAQMSFLTTSIIGARKAFDGLSGIDTNNLQTFKGQFFELAQTISQSPFLDTAGKANKLIDMLTKMGAPTKEITDAAKGGFEAIKSYGGSFLEAADNGLRLQNVVIQLASKTGNLNELYRKSGSDLGNINSVLSQYNAIISDTVKATGLNEKQIELYYTQLGTVPKILESNITGLAGMSSGMNMLTASIKLATGTGRNYEDVVKDLHSAFKDYGIVGQDALQFTQRFSELSNKFGIELEVVRSELFATTNLFRNMTDAGAAAARMTENISGVMNDYVNELQKAGMRGPQALNVMKDMLGATSQLSVAQKSFLSAQTGGPGGLMGAFQIEKMIKEGNTAEVFKKVQQTLEKQFGQIYTLDEASQSQAAASQFMKQRLLLKQGPLGNMVKTDEDANYMLEVLKGKQKGTLPSDMGKEGLNQLSLQEAIAKGTSIEEKSFTELSAINQNIAAIRRSADIPALGLIQKSSTASAGATTFLGPDTDAQRDMRINLKSQMTNAAKRSGITQAQFSQKMKGDMPIDNISGTAAVDSINDFNNWFENIPNSFKSILDTLKQSVISGDKEAVESQTASIMKDIKNKREAAAKMSLQEKQKALAAAQIEEDAVKGTLNWWKQYQENPNISPGASVNAAPKMQPAIKKSNNTNSNLPTPEVYVTEDGATGRIKVQVNVKVLEDGGQGKSITPTF